MQRKGPLPGKIFARCIPKRRFAGLFGYMARISCQSQLISDTWRANLAREGRFSRPGPLLGCIERKTCHGLPPGDASRENIATAGRRGMHQGIILPRLDARAGRPTPLRLPFGPRPERPPRPTPQRHVPQRYASQRHRCSRRTPPLAPSPRARRGTTAPCAVRGAFAAAEKVSCGLRVSMQWNEPPVSV